MKKIVILILMTIQLTTLSGQTNDKVDEAINTYKSGKVEKALGMMEKIVNKEPTNDNWDLLVRMYLQRYDDSKEHAKDAIAKAFGESLGIKTKENDFPNPQKCYDDFVAKCLEAELYSESPIASQYLRNYFIDYLTDTIVPQDAKEEFNKAEKFFTEKDFKNSKLHYQNAIAIKPDYYKATIYLGDSYWYLDNIDSAIYFFSKGIEMNPNLLEPKKYLVDALGYSKKNEQAKSVCIDAICTYPDESMFMKYSDLIKRDGKKFNKHWTKRGCTINRMQTKSSKTKEAVWKVYQEAVNDINAYCNNSGIIIKPNTITNSKYLEVYSWEKMLKSSSKLPDELSFAEKMADNGFLDCYVFISAFHIDLYSQYTDFVKNNKERIKTYIETYLVE